MTGPTARALAAVAIVGAAAQLGYGVLAVVFPWPEIVSPWGEALWMVANLGLIAGLAGWAVAVAPGRTVTVGAAVAGLGFAVRIVAAMVTIADPETEPLPLVLASIALSLAGVLTVAVGTLRAGPVRSMVAWLPMIAFAVELGLAAMYSAATVLHFVLLGLLWGTVAMAMALVVRSRAEAITARAARPAATT